MEVRYIISEEEAQYMERYKGHFSKKMAEWAISMMERDGRKIEPYSLEETNVMLAPYKNLIGEECVYDAWYWGEEPVQETLTEWKGFYDNK